MFAALGLLRRKVGPHILHRNVTSFKKTTQLKNMLNSEKIEFIMEAHSGISARIVEEAGTNSINFLSC